MSDLIAFVLASLPVLAFVALVVEALRLGTRRGGSPTVSLTYRAYGA